MISKEIDCSYTREVVCPYCGQMVSDSWELDDDGDYICDVCENEFFYYRNVEVTYSTEKKKEN